MQLEVEEKSVKRSVGGVFCCNQASRKDGVLKEWDVLIRCSNNIGRLMRRVGGEAVIVTMVQGRGRTNLNFS